MSAPNTYLQKTKRRIIPTFRFYFWRIPFRFSELCQQRHTRNQPGNQRTRNPLEETWNWNWTRNPLNSKFSQSLLSSAQSRPVTDKALEDNFHMRRGGYKEKIAALFICPTDWLNFFFFLGGGALILCACGKKIFYSELGDSSHGAWRQFLLDKISKDSVSAKLSDLMWGFWIWNLKIRTMEPEKLGPFFLLFLIRKRLSIGQKWFLRPYFPPIRTIFVFRSGLRFSFRALEVAQPRVRKRSF